MPAHSYSLAISKIGADMTPKDAIRECPFCKEQIKAGAIKCKHCRSAVRPQTPPHGGTCPFCKEEIKPEAIKCKHCGSMVDGSDKSGCCEGCAQPGASFQGASERAISGSFGANNPFPSPTEATVVQKAGCSSCQTFRTSPFTFAGNRLCCGVVCLPFLGCRRYCWAEACEPFSDQPVIQA